MGYQCSIKHQGNSASSHTLTLGLSESKLTFCLDCHTASGSSQARPAASWRGCPILVPPHHAAAILENEFHTHKNYFVERYPELIIQGDSIYLMAHILFLHHKLLNALRRVIMYQTPAHSMAPSCKTASVESSCWWRGGYW